MAERSQAFRDDALRRLWPWGRTAQATKGDDGLADTYREQAWVLAFVSSYWFARALARIALALAAFYFELTGVVLQVAITVAIILPLHLVLLHLVLSCRDGPAPGTTSPGPEGRAPDTALRKAVRWWLGYYRWAGLLLATGVAGYLTAEAVMPFTPIRYQVLLAALGVAEPSIRLAVQVAVLAVVLWLTARTLGRA